ncbi:MAG TPA: hypothetical protein VNI02_03640 [Blastocatellia bacterium]|nr:hypothetical protein [Blastocatellia bacterium]
MCVTAVIYSSIWIIIRLIDTQTLKAQNSKCQLVNAPGARLLALTDFLFSQATVENTFKPIIADWRYEYFEALKQNRKWKARWISVRYRFSFINTMTLSKVFSLLKQIKSVTK